MFGKKVIIDTNFLMLPGSIGIDVFAEIQRVADFKVQFCVIDKTLDELWMLTEGKKQDSMNAKMGLIMLQNKGLKKLKSTAEESVDDAIVRLSSKVKAVATQDKELRKRIGNKCSLFVMRGKNQIVML